MKDPKPQYPASLFWTGVALSILRSLLWLVLATVLMLLGAKTPWLGWAGLALLALVVAIALIKQLSYRHTVLHSDTPEFDDWQAAMLSPDWEENVKDMVQRAMNDTEADLYMEEEDSEEDKNENYVDRKEEEDSKEGAEVIASICESLPRGFGLCSAVWSKPFYTVSIRTTMS